MWEDLIIRPSDPTPRQKIKLKLKLKPERSTRQSTRTIYQEQSTRLVKAIPCIGKDLGMSTIEYASLMVELQHDAYNSKTRESHIFEGICVSGVKSWLVGLTNVF